MAVINTYLAEAQGDYRDRNGYATLEVNGITTDAKGNYVKDAGSTGNEKSLRAYTEDFAIVEDIVDGDMFLVTVADKEIQSIADPELVSEVSINSFRRAAGSSARVLPMTTLTAPLTTRRFLTSMTTWTRT